MSADAPTSWHLVRRAADGRDDARAEFVRRYEPVVRAYLAARWRRAPLSAELDDAAQEVFLDCFRQDGALGRADPAKPQRFRAFLYGVTRIVARRIERERAVRARHVADDGSAVEGAPARGESLSRVFDRAWASALLRRAAHLQEERAGTDDARRRVELLRLRFREGLAVRDVAARWGADPAWVHHQFATARDEFRRALEDVVREECGPGRVEADCDRLLAHFSS
jgi:RNA polymerase sigma-70 factor (ECF subfamily)